MFLEGFVLSHSDNTSLSHKKRVLIVDDDDLICRELVKVLEKNGFEADFAETGQEGIEKLKTQVYDALVVDLKLPDMEGTAILSRLTASNTVKIMVTGYPSLVSSIQAMDNGVDAYLPKPVKPEELMMLIRMKLAEHK